MKKLLAVFDLDGTLLNSLTDLAEACNYALHSAGFPLHQEEAYKLFVGNGTEMLIERSLPPENRTPETIKRIRGLFSEHYDVHCNDNTRPYPGTGEMLKALKEADVRTAVLTNKPHAFARPLVESTFPGLIDLVLGQREGVPLKPDPTALLEVLKHFGSGPEGCAYIGDSSVDVHTGLAGGLFTVGVTWGYRTKDELKKAGAHVIVDKVEELIPILVDN